MVEEVNLNGIQDKNTRECIKKLLNIIKNMISENLALKEEIQRLRKENLT